MIQLNCFAYIAALLNQLALRDLWETIGIARIVSVMTRSSPVATTGARLSTAHIPDRAAIHNAAFASLP